MSKLALTLQIPSTPPSSSSSSPVLTHSYFSDSAIQTPTTTVETTQSELPITVNATASSSSLPTLNVKFAPLPELLPRKRRSVVPLGMAARGQLVRRRSGYRNPNAHQMWTDEGSEELRMRQEELAARQARCAAYAAHAAAREQDADDADDDWPRQRHQRRGRKKKGEEVHEVDPLQVFGRMVKVAGKTLWKRVSNKDMATAATASIPTSKEVQEDTGNRPSNTGSPIPTQAPVLPSPTRSILGIISSNTTSVMDDIHIEKYEEKEEDRESRVWEEEINNFPLNVGQTETIVEGRGVYSHLTSKVEVPSPILLNPKKRSSFYKTP